MGFIVFFDTIFEFYCIISTNFYLYLQYFQPKKKKKNQFQLNKLFPNKP